MVFAPLDHIARLGYFRVSDMRVAGAAGTSSCA